MDNTFKELVSGRGFERKLNHHFSDLDDLGIDYRHVYAEDDENPFIRIDLLNRQIMSRITQWESGHCEIEIVSFKDSSSLGKDELKFGSFAEFDNRLAELINHMKETRQPH